MSAVKAGQEGRRHDGAAVPVINVLLEGEDLKTLKIENSGVDFSSAVEVAFTCCSRSFHKDNQFEQE